MSEREQALERVKEEVSKRQDRERREQAERKQIERDGEIDWRSYQRRSIPSRWRA